MATAVSTWPAPPSLRTPLVKSVVAHVLLFLGIAGYFFWQNWGRETFGDPNSIGGGAVTITPVATIPLPRQTGRVNPVADDTESQAPSLPQPKPQAATPPPEDAVALKKRKAEAEKKKPEQPKRVFRRSGETEPQPNQVYSSQGQRLVSPMMGSQQGGSGVGVGPSSPFGDRFGYYADLIRQRVAEKWNTGDVSPNLKTAPIVIVTFDILRDGSVRNVRVVQPSGISALDYSAQRAIIDASPFPPLPNGFQRSSANVEFQFQFQR